MAFQTEDSEEEFLRLVLAGQAGADDFEGRTFDVTDKPPRRPLDVLPSMEGRTFKVTDEPAEKVVQVPGPMTDLEMAYAKEQERAARRRMAMERGSRELVAGLTRTQPTSILSQPSQAVAQLLAKRKDADARAAQQASAANEAARTRAYADAQRLAAERGEGRDALNAQRLEQEGELGREKLELGKERLALDKSKATKPKGSGPPKVDASGLPHGWELETDSTSTRQQREKFAGVVQSSEKMRGLTMQMRALLKEAGAGRMLPGSAKTKVSQLATLIQLEAKNVADLGALSGPDMALMEAVAADPSKIQSFARDIPALLDGLDSWSANAISAGAKTLGARPRGAQSTPPKEAPSRVVVSNGTETLEIDAADLAAAEADGFKRVQ